MGVTVVYIIFYNSDTIRCILSDYVRTLKAKVAVDLGFFSLEEYFHSQIFVCYIFQYVTII